MNVKHNVSLCGSPHREGHCSASEGRMQYGSHMARALFMLISTAILAKLQRPNDTAQGLDYPNAVTKAST